ncbi:MAG: phosphoenolpyruvate carboxylase [Acetobacter sp.]|nr:phosphoenolpyruvate carboxylase [Acetobacter sp.]
MTLDFSSLSPRLNSLLTSIMATTSTLTDDYNPVMTLALHISKAFEKKELNYDDLRNLIYFLRDSAFLKRARRLHDYAHSHNTETASAISVQERFQRVAQHILKTLPTPTFEAYRDAISRVRFAAVFTAHPTFALDNAVYAALAESASCAVPPQTAPFFETHRRSAPPTLDEEFTLATQAISHARNAIDLLTTELLKTASEQWATEWTTLIPCPVIATSWVGYDTDGRMDIGWWDTLRLRLKMKRLQLVRLQEQITRENILDTELNHRIDNAIVCVTKQIEAAPSHGADVQAVARFAQLLVTRKYKALTDPFALNDSLQAAIDQAPPDSKMRLAVARAGFLAHGLGLAHTHVRLNAAQIHNYIRQKLNFLDDPNNPSCRRALLNRANEALDSITPVPVDFGAILGASASSERLIMTIAQITKFIDSRSPIRFLIAETETGYTLLMALWMATYFGVDQHVEISPLFETYEAIVHGERIIEEALRSAAWRDYIRRMGRLCLQFGYSDSGRYIGQLGASYLIERLRLKICTLLTRFDLTDIEVVLFDTHGESIGRGAHPFHMADRLSYLFPAYLRNCFKKHAISYREETSFQGGDGYLLFGTQELANATLNTIVDNIFLPAAQEENEDPIYDDPDFSTDFFHSMIQSMEKLVDDTGYASLLGTFGPSLIDRTGSRPPARESADSITKKITHPSQLRAITNNAILQQLGWCANTIHGLGKAARLHADTFNTFQTSSRRFRRALDFVSHGLACSDDKVLKSIVHLLDPTFWLDRATEEKDLQRRQAFLYLMNNLEKLNLSTELYTMFRRIQVDHIAIREVWKDAPTTKPRIRLLHALRLMIIEQIWLLACRIPFFTPRDGYNHSAMMRQVLCLEIPSVLQRMVTIFPIGNNPSHQDFYEPQGQHNEEIYIREHWDIFTPMEQLFKLLREVSVALIHDIGAFG